MTKQGSAIKDIKYNTQQNPRISKMCQGKEDKKSTIHASILKLFKKQIEHDKREMVFEVLAPLAENGEKINAPLDS